MEIITQTPEKTLIEITDAVNTRTFKNKKGDDMTITTQQAFMFGESKYPLSFDLANFDGEVFTPGKYNLVGIPEVDYKGKLNFKTGLLAVK